MKTRDTKQAMTQVWPPESKFVFKYWNPKPVIVAHKCSLSIHRRLRQERRDVMNLKPAQGTCLKIIIKNRKFLSYRKDKLT